MFPKMQVPMRTLKFYLWVTEGSLSSTHRASQTKDAGS